MSDDITFEEWLQAVRETETPKNIVWIRDIAKQLGIKRCTFYDCLRRYGYWEKTVKIRTKRGLKEEDAKEFCLLMIREGYGTGGQHPSARVPGGRPVRNLPGKGRG